MSEAPIRILVLDDEVIVGRRLKPALEKQGYHVETFDDGQAALRRLTEQRFDVVVTDVRMEGVGGIRVLEEVLERSPRTRVIVISGYATLEVAQEALVKGAFDFLAKPFKPEDLRRVIAKAVSSLDS